MHAATDRFHSPQDQPLICPTCHAPFVRGGRVCPICQHAVVGHVSSALSPMDGAAFILMSGTLGGLMGGVAWACIAAGFTTLCMAMIAWGSMALLTEFDVIESS